MKSADDMTSAQPVFQRIDKWLWFARFFKTRSLAAQFVSAGKIRLSVGTRQSAASSQRISKPSQAIKPGNVLTFLLHGHVRVIEVVDGGQRRGPAAEAARLYRDLAPRVKAVPRPPEPELVAERAKGSGRPTKKQRRALDNWLNEADSGEDSRTRR